MNSNTAKPCFHRSLLACIMALTLSCQSVEPTAQADHARPNILLIVVDDVGFADLGAFGGEIPTPNLDDLAYTGLRLANFHVAPTCSPTRSMLLSGVDSHIAGLGNMFEELAPNQKGQPGYEGYLHERVAALPALFQDAGYQTFMSGKWHLGLEDDQGPDTRGFDRSFALLQGGAGHFADMQALFHNEVGSLGKALYREDGQILDTLPDNFDYSSQFYVDKLIDYLDKGDTQKPFFAYLAFSAPHWPLQAPAETIAKYKGRYDRGYEALAAQRLQRQKQLGLIPHSAKLSPRPNDAAAWDSMPLKERQLSARRMEIYAAMLDEIDRHTGRLLDYLRQRGDLDNTIIVFTSDNGAEGHGIDGLFPQEHFPAARKWVLETHKYDLDALGGPGSYVLYGPGWGWAGAPAFRGYKAYVSQGGTRVPAFVYHPRLQTRSAIAQQMLSVKDIAPTLLELAGLPPPSTQFRGRAVEPITGLSFAPILTGQTSSDLPPRVLGVELFGKRSIRQGPWNMLEMFKPQGTGEWQLYNIESDLAEQNDLAEQRPDKLRELQALWEEYARENGVIIPDWNSGY